MWIFDRPNRPSAGSGSIVRALAVCLAALLLLSSCAPDQKARGPEREGDVLFRAESPAATSEGAQAVPGPPLHRLGILIPAKAPAWQAAWVEGKSNAGGGQGAMAGFVMGIGMLQAAPVALLFWPAAVGMVAGATTFGALGGQIEETPLSHVTPADRAAMLEAAGTLKPDQLMREAAREALDRRLHHPMELVEGPENASEPGPQFLAAAHTRGLDGVLDLTLQGFGLAAGEEKRTYAVFLQLRARILGAPDGRLRYQRIFEYGPGRPPLHGPRPDWHTVEFLAMDQARVFRMEVREAILRTARALARDPALPVAAP